LFREVEHVVEFFAAGTGSELFELLAEILHRVAQHGELAKGTLRVPIREAGLTVEEFIQLL
jgi:hypothetical protein